MKFQIAFIYLIKSKQVIFEEPIGKNLKKYAILSIATYCSRHKLKNWNCGPKCNSLKNQVIYTKEDKIGGNFIYISILNKEELIVSYRGYIDLNYFI